MEPLILFAIFICFFTTYLTMPFWIRKARQIDFVWADMNKVGFPKKSAGSGGLIVLFGTTIGILIYIAINIFILNLVETF